MRTPRPMLLLCCLSFIACGGGEGTLEDIGETVFLKDTDGYLSIVDFERAHEEGGYFEVVPDASSPFDEVTRAQSGLTWLYLARDVVVPRGRWKLDLRFAIPEGRVVDGELRIKYEPGCGPDTVMPITASGLGEDAWQILPEEGLGFSVPRTCTVRISFLDSKDIKMGWGLDWMRIVPAN